MKTGHATREAVQRAALALHGLAGVDRDWVLQGLPAEQQRTLQPLLAELRELGIPHDATLLEELLREPEQGATPQAPPHPLDALDAAELEALARILEDEPPRLVAVLLATREWPWRQRLLAGLDPRRRAAVQRAGDGAAPMVQAAVLAQVIEQLAAGGGPAPQVPAWRRAHAWLRRLRRPQ